MFAFVCNLDLAVTTLHKTLMHAQHCLWNKKKMMIGDLATASAIKSLGELRRDCSLNKCYKAFSTERLVQKQKVKGQLFPLEKYPSQPSSYYCLLSQRPSQKRGRGLGEVTETKITVIKEDSSTPWSQEDKAIQRAVPCH